MKDPRMLKRMMDEAKKAQQKLENEMTKFEAQTFEQTFGTNHIKIEIKGSLEIVKLEINSSLLEDKEFLEETVVDAINQVVKNIIAAKEELEQQLMPKQNLF
ncbi:YbaB/EbfC family nucleoid-associated protein [[Mycoplasma] cavipharyngis]|uniref:YbaB/EbfC family nucleoid-associated protein n=1 Tax=[Mycoplasma] cavipharyngis TaxID=92757 RepID=UPI003703B098